MYKMLEKHKSKLYKGFIKQVSRQDEKESFVKVKIMPVILSYNSKASKYKPLKKKFWNNKWNGMNLKNLCNYFSEPQPDWMYSKVRINKDGKYTLSIHGKSILKKKRQKQLTKV